MAALAAQAARLLRDTAGRCAGREGAAEPWEGTGPEPGQKPRSGDPEAGRAPDGGCADAFVSLAAGAAAAMLAHVRTQATYACLHYALLRGRGRWRQGSSSQAAGKAAAMLQWCADVFSARYALQRCCFQGKQYHDAP